MKKLFYILCFLLAAVNKHGGAVLLTQDAAAATTEDIVTTTGNATMNNETAATEASQGEQHKQQHRETLQEKGGRKFLKMSNVLVQFGEETLNMAEVWLLARRAQRLSPFRDHDDDYFDSGDSGFDNNNNNNNSTSSESSEEEEADTVESSILQGLRSTLYDDTPEWYKLLKMSYPLDMRLLEGPSIVHQYVVNSKIQDLEDYDRDDEEDTFLPLGGGGEEKVLTTVVNFFRASGVWFKHSMTERRTTVLIGPASSSRYVSEYNLFNSFGYNWAQPVVLRHRNGRVVHVMHVQMKTGNSLTLYSPDSDRRADFHRITTSKCFDGCIDRLLVPTPQTQTNVTLLARSCYTREWYRATTNAKATACIAVGKLLTTWKPYSDVFTNLDFENETRGIDFLRALRTSVQRQLYNYVNRKNRKASSRTTTTTTTTTSAAPPQHNPNLNDRCRKYCPMEYDFYYKGTRSVHAQYNCEFMCIHVRWWYVRHGASSANRRHLSKMDRESDAIDRVIFMERQHQHDHNNYAYSAIYGKEAHYELQDQSVAEQQRQERRVQELFKLDQEQLKASGVKVEKKYNENNTIVGFTVAGFSLLMLCIITGMVMIGASLWLIVRRFTIYRNYTYPCVQQTRKRLHVINP